MDPRPNHHELAYRIRLITAQAGTRRHRWAIVHTDSDAPVTTSSVAYLTMRSAFEAAEPVLKSWLEIPHLEAQVPYPIPPPVPVPPPMPWGPIGDEPPRDELPPKPS